MADFVRVVRGSPQARERVTANPVIGSVGAATPIISPSAELAFAAVINQLAALAGTEDLDGQCRGSIPDGQFRELLTPDGQCQGLVGLD